MRTRLTALAVLAIGVAGIAAMGAAAASSVTKTLQGHMTGRAETPRGTPLGRGEVKVTLNTVTGKVCWKFELQKIDGKPTAAHIHKGGRGVAGPVVVPFGTAYKPAGCTKAAPSLVKAILADPSGYYVNVHNLKHPAGALRTQL
jgi:CHRD domain